MLYCSSTSSPASQKPYVFDEYFFQGNKLIERKKIIYRKLYKVNKKYISSYIDTIKQNYKNFNEKKVISYFKKSKFKDKLKLFLELTDDNFKSNKNGYLVDFTSNTVQVKKLKSSMLNKLFKNFNYEEKINYLNLKVRKESFFMTVDNFLPFEDLLIGFQCRVNRIPNLYNNNFWHYFSNVYVARKHFRSEKICFSCDTLNQTILNL